MKTKFLFLLLCTLSFSCEESKLKKSNSLEVNLELACGWCFGVESLKIGKSEYYYAYDNACGDSLDLPPTKFETSSSLWNDLVSHINKKKFSKLDLNSCFRCSDGCDYILTITDNEYNHEISFTSISEITESETKNLADRLISLLEEKRKELDAY